jgi:hypothetical protein
MEGEAVLESTSKKESEAVTFNAEKSDIDIAGLIKALAGGWK